MDLSQTQRKMVGDLHSSYSTKRQNAILIKMLADHLQTKHDQMASIKLCVSSL